MTITRELREKVIQLHTIEGRGRNEIARLLNGQGLHISEGSVGNIVRAYREQSLQQQKDTSQSSQGPEADAGINSATPMNIIGFPLLMAWHDYGIGPLILTPILHLGMEAHSHILWIAIFQKEFLLI